MECATMITVFNPIKIILVSLFHQYDLKLIILEVIISFLGVPDLGTSWTILCVLQYTSEVN